MRHVGRDREGARVAVAHQLRVDEGAVGLAVDVGQQAPVAVALLDIADEAHAAARHERRVGGRGALGVALHRRAGLDRLRRVDADVAHALAAAVEAHADGVAVDHAQHLRAPERRRPRVIATVRDQHHHDGQQEDEGGDPAHLDGR